MQIPGSPPDLPSEILWGAGGGRRLTLSKLRSWCILRTIVGAQKQGWRLRSFLRDGAGGGADLEMEDPLPGCKAVTQRRPWRVWSWGWEPAHISRMWALTLHVLRWVGCGWSQSSQLKDFTWAQRCLPIVAPKMKTSLGLWNFKMQESSGEVAWDCVFFPQICTE